MITNTIRRSASRTPLVGVVVLLLLTCTTCTPKSNVAPGSQDTSIGSNLVSAKDNVKSSQGDVHGASISPSDSAKSALPFELRSPVGKVKETQPEYLVFGRPKTIEFSSWALQDKNDGGSQRSRAIHRGIVEYDNRGRKVARGYWRDGAMVKSVYRYGEDGRVRETRTFRNDELVGPSATFTYSRCADRVIITEQDASTGMTIGTEIQYIDDTGRLITNIVDNTTTLLKFVYAYDGAGRPIRIDRYERISATSSDTDLVATDSYVFEYNGSGHVSKFTALGYWVTRMSRHSTSYQYDSVGNVIGAQSGDSSRRSRFEYVFDDRGNWQRSYELSRNGDKSNVRPVFEINRTITYWD